MAINRWRGDYLPRAQVVTLTVGSATAGHTFVVTMNGKVVSYTAVSGDTTATIAAALQALLAGATTIPEFNEVTWAVDTTSANVIVGTAATPGVPFTATLSGTGTFTLATPTASTGPNHVDEPKNWSLGTVPGATDDVLVDGGADLLYGWGALSAAAYASLRVKASFAGQIGLPFYNPSGYVEYRARAWPVNTAVPVLIGEGSGEGPTLVNLACGAALDLTVFKTGNRAVADAPVVNVSGPTSGTCSVAAGDVGIAADDDTLTASGITVALDGDASALAVGRAATVATLNQSGGTVVALGTVTTVTVTGGTATLYRAPTTITADAAGTVDCRFTGTVTTATFRGQGTGAGGDGGAGGGPVCQCGNDPRPRTFTNSTFVGGAPLRDPDKTVTFTNQATFDRASLAASDLGARFTLQRA